MTLSHTIELSVNGRPRTADVAPRLLLLHFLRDTLGLTGTHSGCDTSQCGACTVLVDGAAVKSCTVLAVQVAGRTITTVEGLAQGERLHPIQQAFWDAHGLQCGFCTPGMMLTAIDLLARSPHPAEAEVREALSGNLCRCTGYQHIVAAVQRAAAAMRPTEPAE